MKKQIYSVFAVSGVLLLMLSIFNSCRQEETFAKATVETSQVASIAEATATSGGTISSDGGATVTARGVCWNTTSAPTIANSKTANGGGIGSYTSSITGLTPSTTYYVRSYATNSVGTSYGNEVTFTTQSGVIGLTTTVVSSITLYSATSGGTISSDGGVAVATRGVCWNTTSAPTIANSKTANGGGIGTFTANITGLTPSTTYYVRAYAINSVGTTYGNEVSFTSLSTSGTVTDIEGYVYNYITIGTQTWMTENLTTSTCNDGTSIPYVYDDTDWATIFTPGFCFYNHDDSNLYKYGVLYNWWAVNTHKLAPTGWHVPTDAEWTTLENYLIANGYNYDGTTTGNNIAKSLAATTGWPASTNTGAVGNDLTKNNTSGFAGLPGGYRNSGGPFGKVGYSGYWWSSTQYSTDYAWYRGLGCNYSYVSRANLNKQGGFYVRCVRDF